MIRIPPQRGGWLEVICGPMFSGKSEEMIRRLRRAEIAGQRVVIFKPQIDDRYDATDVVSHAGARMQAVPVASVSEMTEAHAEGYEVVGIDEAQFLGEGVVACRARPRRPRRARGRRRTRPGLPPPAVRADAGAPRARGVRRQAAGGLPPLRRAGDDDAAARRRPASAVLGRDGRGRRGASSTRRAAAAATRRASVQRSSPPSPNAPRTTPTPSATTYAPAATRTIVPPGGRSA